MAVVMTTGSQSLLALGTKTKLRGGGREGKASQEGVSSELVGFSWRRKHPSDINLTPEKRR